MGVYIGFCLSMREQPNLVYAVDKLASCWLGTHALSMFILRSLLDLGKMTAKAQGFQLEVKGLNV